MGFRASSVGKTRSHGGRGQPHLVLRQRNVPQLQRINLAAQQAAVYARILPYRNLAVVREIEARVQSAEWVAVDKNRIRATVVYADDCAQVLTGKECRHAVLGRLGNLGPSPNAELQGHRSVCVCAEPSFF